MAKPWEKYGAQPVAAQKGPWDRYAPKADFSGVSARVDSTEQQVRNPEGDSTSASAITGAAQTQARPSLFRNDSDFYEKTGISRMSPRIAWAAAKDTFGSRQGAAEYLAEQTGGSVIADEKGEPILRLPDGTQYRLNDEGLDSSDVASFASNVGAFFIPAGIAARVNQARGVGLAGRVTTQGAAAAGTDAAMQAAFNGGQIDPARVGIAAAGGAGGEALGSGIATVAARIRPPATAARQTAATVTQAPSRVPAVAREIEAGANPDALIGQERFGLSYTQGQRTLEPARQYAQLSREELLRQNPKAGSQFREQMTQNAQAVERSLGQFGERLGGAAAATPAEMAQGAASRLSQQADELSGRINEAYSRAGEGARTSVGRDAVTALPQRLKQSVSEFAPNRELTPATAKTLEQVDNATRMILGGERSNVAGVTLKALETQRRIINNNIAAAANPTDRKAMLALKGEFDGWLDDSINNALLTGDAKALEAIKEARGLRAEYGRRFQGGEDSDRFIAGLLDGSKTPEELVNVALGASQVSKAGGARFIERLKVAAGDDPAVIGNLRAAHFLRMTRGADGKPLDMGQIVRNIRSTEYNNASIVKALYSPQEWMEVKQLANALEPLVSKGDFAKSSGTAERLARMLFQRVGDVPVVGWGTRFAGDTIAQFRADRALNAPLRLRVQSSPRAPATVSAAASERAR